jgi:hypothetical protein
VGLKGIPWVEIKPQDRARLRRLVFALSKYQVHLHPRTSLSYAGDIDVVDTVENVRLEYPLHSNDKEIIPISVHGVIPDTLLASTSWVFGSKQGGFDFYDTCIVILNTPEGMISIPAARALSTQLLQENLDYEHGVEVTHLPRGCLLPQGRWTAQDAGIEVQWCCWIPCSGRRWLYFNTEQMKFKGSKNASVLSDQQVTDMLKTGKIFVSLKHVDEVKEVVQNSVLACGHLLDLLV